MKFISTIAIIAAATLGATAVPQDFTFCTTACHPDKPVCAAGQAASGNEGCWGCCVPLSQVPATTTSSPIPWTVPTSFFCTNQCRPERPVCASDEKASGSAGCWGCCEKIVS